MALKPEQIWEGAVYRMTDGTLRKVLECSRDWVQWEFLRPDCAPEGHLGRQPGYTFSAELRRFAAGAAGELRT